MVTDTRITNCTNAENGSVSPTPKMEKRYACTAFILRQIDSKRLEKAVAALKQGAYILRTTRITDGTVSVFVDNEKGRPTQSS
jgi:hypothetical protein